MTMHRGHYGHTSSGENINTLTYTLRGHNISARIFMQEMEQSELLVKLLAEKKIAREFQDRRRDDWIENYELYRNRVRINKLTQRQAVNIPLMKETLKTILAKIDDPPTVDWEELSGDESKELIFQEMWNADYERLGFEGIDIQDKKTVLMYGRSFKLLNWTDEGIDVQPLDIYDVVVDPFTLPLDLDSARFLIRQNIFRSLREIIADDRYSKEGKDKLKTWLTSKEGIIQSSQNAEEYRKKQERLQAMGVNDSDFPLFAAGDQIVNLSEHFTNVWDTKQEKFVKHVIVYADDSVELSNETLDSLLGIDFWPFSTWAEDIETTDFWSDAVADLVRTPNKVVNVMFSQLVENRTLRNFQMHWVVPQDGYTMQTYEPGAGRMLPAPNLRPGQSIRDVIQPVEISGLDEALTSIDFITKMVERGTSATAIEKGVSERKQITLGEVQTLVGKAMERTLAMAKFYRRSWYDLAWKWHAIMDANANKKQTLYKTGANGKVWPKVVYPSDWKSKAGYRPIVRSTSEQEEEKSKGIQRFMFIKGMFPNNPSLNRIIQQRSLELVDLTPAELRLVEEDEKKVQEQQAQLAQQAAVQPAQPQEPQTLQQVNQNINQLEAINA